MKSPNKLKHFTALATTATLGISTPFPSIKTNSVADDIFYEDFSGDTLDTDSWLIAQKNWGGTVNNNGITEDYNGGVISDNVAVRDGKLILTGLGNYYNGDLCGINRDKSRRSDGKRCGGAIATKDYFASGSYEISAKISPELGCCSAMWTFEYEENYSNGKTQIINHEIDIEFPGRNENNDFSLSHALCTTWIGEGDDEHETASPYCGIQNDGKFHTYRFDWHTGSDNETPRVEYYFDGVLTYTSYKFIPTNSSRFWLGLWFPKGWAGTPDFEQTDFEIDYVKITPFHEPGDTTQHESYPESGWDENAELPKGWILWHSYSDYSALDSKLYLRSPDGSTKTISGDFYHPMNASFGITPDNITFMAIDKEKDEWDIYIYGKGNIINLTQSSGFRNEDPKWSPDGKSIVFKRGHWSQDINDFSYDIAIIDVETGKITMLTNDNFEEAMPCFSEDGKSVYFTKYSNCIGSICKFDIASGKEKVIFSENGVNAYYPVVSGDKLYFTKWLDENNHADQIVCYDGSKISSMPFDSDKYDSSDACPIGDDKMIFSSTMNGEYDLYYFDGTNISPLDDLNSDKNDLGADFYSVEDHEDYIRNNPVPGDVDMDGEFTLSDLVLFQKWLLGDPGTELKNSLAADFCSDNILDAFDLCMMRNEITKTPHSF